MTRVAINLTAGKDHVGQPWIWRVAREFNVKVNVMKANIDEDFGWVQIELEGPLEDVQRATAWLMTTGMHVEAQERALGA
jgi:L-aspartate semialdehyde sulfurtransferase ferredoxin